MVKKTWTYTSSPHTSSWRSALLVKHRDNFYGWKYEHTEALLTYSPVVMDGGFVNSVWKQKDDSRKP